VALTLIESIGLVAGDVVALVGAGGKTTIAHQLLAESVDRGWKVVFTTTTRIGSGQTMGLPMVEPEGVVAALAGRGACVMARPWKEGRKLVGPGPEFVESVARSADLVIVEADGAREMRVKAPAPHEPVIPASSTVVVAVIAADGINRVIEDACHRPLRVGAVVGAGPYDRLTPERAARLLSSPDGGRKGVPPGARFVVAITKVDDETRADTDEVTRLLAPIQVVEVARNDQR
jgi:molybdenum cofactor cytidylyltransferase